MTSLVGFSGFVGSNLKEQGDFSQLYNSKNIGEAFGTSPDVLYYSGLPAEKFLADKFPDKDKERVLQAAENIKKINPKRVVLISTVDVYANTDNRTEDDLSPSTAPYGANRLWLEQYVADNYSKHHIIRLPGLFGNNIKKNFIYDFIVFTPALLTGEKIAEFGSINSKIYDMYTKQDNGFYKLNPDTDKTVAKQLFKELNFSALNFTDSRAVFQFYNLARLYTDINTAIAKDIKLLNLATEPISVAELYSYLTGETFVNELQKAPPYYNFKSRWYDLFDGKNGYLYNKESILLDIKNFVDRYKI